MKRLMIAATMFLFVASVVFADTEMSKKLKGDWVLDTAASLDAINNDPNISDEDKTMMPRMMPMLESALFSFSDKQAVCSIGGNTQTIQLTPKSSDSKCIMFDCESNGEKGILTATFNDEGRINIAMTAAKQMSAFIWMRKPAGEASEPMTEEQRTEMAGEVMKEALKQQGWKEVSEDAPDTANSSVVAGIEEGYEEKSIKIQKAGGFEKDKQVEILVGDKIKFKIPVYETDFFGQTVISANANVSNTTDQKVQAIYSISFHDEAGKLVACLQGSLTPSPNSNVSYGSGMSYTDSESIATITSYKLRTQVIKSKK